MSYHGSYHSDRRSGSASRRRILYVTGLDPDTRAKDVGREFERCGPLIRCDVPIPATQSRSRTLFAFVEFEDWRDAQDAYEQMHNRRTSFGRLQVEVRLENFHTIPFILLEWLS